MEEKCIPATMASFPDDRFQIRCRRNVCGTDKDTGTLSGDAAYGQSSRTGDHFISGNRPIDLILQDPEILVSLDGRPDDLVRNIATARMPVISTSLATIGSWDGRSLMPRTMRKSIQQLAKACHTQGKSCAYGPSRTPNYPGPPCSAWASISSIRMIWKG